MNDLIEQIQLALDNLQNNHAFPLDYRISVIEGKSAIIESNTLPAIRLIFEGDDTDAFKAILSCITFASLVLPDMLQLIKSYDARLTNIVIAHTVICQEIKNKLEQ